MERLNEAIDALNGFTARYNAGEVKGLPFEGMLLEMKVNDVANELVDEGVMTVEEMRVYVNERVDSPRSYD